MSKILSFYDAINFLSEFKLYSRLKNPKDTVISFDQKLNQITLDTIGPFSPPARGALIVSC